MSVELRQKNENVQPDDVEAVTLECAAHAALEEYHSCIRAKILGRAMVESADAAADALTALTESHSRTVGQLHTQISKMQEQLCGAARLIEQLSSQMGQESMRLSSYAANDSASPLRGSLTLDVCSSSREEVGLHSTLPLAKTDKSHPSLEQDHTEPYPKESTLSVEAASSDAFATAQSGDRCTRETLHEEMNASNSLLVAEVIEGRGTLKLHEQQRTVMVKQLQELTTLLSKVVEENAGYRQEIYMLRAMSIPVAEHQQLLDERNALEQECKGMKLELTQLKEEVEMALIATSAQQHPMIGMGIPDVTPHQDEISPVLQASSQLLPPHPFSQQQEQQPSVDTTHASTTTEGGFYAAQSLLEEGSHNVLDYTGSALQHTELWKNAIRELEQQATLAASQMSAAERLREAEARIEELQACNTELRTSLENLETEDRCVREDCEQLTFRNAVLSQQVTSLLVRVEQQRRALQRSEEHHRYHLEQNEEIEEAGEGDDVYSVADSEILLEGEFPTRGEPRGRVASAVQAILEQRQAVSGHATGRRGTTTGGGTGVGVNGVSAILDVSLPPAGSLEVEGGVRTSLGVFARTGYRPRRSLQLRNFGSPTVEVEHARVPRLPASDQLSGVALGRASYYTTVNPVRNSAVQRSGVDGIVESHHTGSSSNHSEDRKRRRRERLLGSVATTLVVSENSEENRRFLEVLREDENFDRYAVNSVLELLQRNQELLKQLYLATQRADSVEELLRQQRGVEQGRGSHSSSDTEAAQAHVVNSRKRKREGYPSTFDLPPAQGQTENDIMRGASAEGVLDCGAVFRNTSGSITAQQGGQGEEEMERGEESADMKNTPSPLLGFDTRYMQLEAHIDGQIDAVLRKHNTELMLTDKSLAASLLRIMELGRRPGVDNSGNNNNNARDVAVETMKDAVIASLVRVCTQQGVRVAQQSIELAAAQQSCHAGMMRECWKEAQRLLLRSVADLQAAVTRVPIASDSSVVRPGVSSHTVAMNERVEGGESSSEGGELQLLQNIASLLRTASLKEHTVQRVLLLASQRQRMIRRTLVEPGHAAGNSHNAAIATDDDNNNNNADDDDNDSDIISLDEDQHTLQQLRTQLNEAQTQYNKLREAHHDERKQHTVLLDRMWRLEEEMVSAVRSRDETQERMATMMTREEYEATVDALDTANANIADLQAQLRHAEEMNKLQQQDVEHWRVASVESERRRVAEAALVGEQLAQKDRLITHHVEQHRLLELHCAELQQRVRQLELEAEQHRRGMMEGEANAKALQEKIHHIELALLEQKCTQDLLFAIFPDDRALAENRNLIQAMREERVKLTEDMTALQLQLDGIKRELAAAQLEIHNAVQARQEAELHLQELMLTRTTLETPVASSSFSTTNTTRAVGAAEEVATTATGFQLLELELLQRANASLLVERRELIEREALLRTQLEALGRDPLSENARRYGLKATHAFEQQLEEIHGRCLALQEKLTAAEALQSAVQQLESEVRRLTAQLESAKKALAEQQEVNTVLQEEVQTITSSLEETTESYNAAKLTLEEKEEQMRGNLTDIRKLETELGKLEDKLRVGDEERERLREDNVHLLTSVTALVEEVKKKEAERRAAQTSLAQGLATAAASQRLRGRSAGGSSGVVPISITGSLGRTTP